MSGNFPFPEYSKNDSTPNRDWVSDYPRSTLGSFETSNHLNAKVAIPRNTPSSSSTTTGRVSRACENCREQKAKCSGHHPVCHRCQDAGVQCSYGDRKREKMVKQLTELSSKVESLETLLCDIYHALDASSARQVDQRLRDLNLHPHPLPNSTLASSQQAPSDAIDSLLAIPTGVVDYTEEDFNRNDKVQAMGFVGDHSEIAWLYRLKRSLDHGNSTPIKEIPEPPAISSMNYFEDESEISVPNTVDLARRPPQHIADKLVENYFHVLHSAFPILGKALFLNQYRSFYSNPSVRPGKRWLAVLNLVFAIATRHASLTDQPQTDYSEHSVYFARAWKLSGSKILLDHPDLQQTQVEGLAAFYLLSIGQVNRSWRTVGVAIRSALAMGLNLRSETDSITHFSRELRYRVWWALYLLDTVLCEMTGRASIAAHTFCTTPLPVPFLEEDREDERVVQMVTNLGARSAFSTSLLSHPHVPPKDPLASKDPEQSLGKDKHVEQKPDLTAAENLTPNASLCFLYAVDLAQLLQRAVDAVYISSLERQSWHEVEAEISTFNTHADNWLLRLPMEFQSPASDTSQEFAQQRVSLTCRYYATKMIILQPCIRHLSQTSEASTPGTLCESMAAICVQIAGQMLDLLPGTGDTNWLHCVAPWWCILHNVMQATTILMTELLTRTTAHTLEAASIITKLKRAIAWLHEMSARDESSRRAWIICTEIVSRHGSRFGLGPV
ncbi:uncharacterized protein N7506_011237 [Penicillium brevicompactum]|uniref:uncharacterized protein n=1 Tax=Penicillium brevicompactum TaxID=5074 RepID=UPI002541C337|nr:uncharacterized protein N7506_011237 [Penicillium brevicompactum]KAJ5322107.1 hypothetical protein N7506_011237 [Penicillium brevicompactum]